MARWHWRDRAHLFVLCQGHERPSDNRRNDLITGAIVTARKFDRERQREYAVTVTATDQAADPLIGICQLNILILDENDNSPKFENLRYECEFMKNSDTQA